MYFWRIAELKSHIKSRPLTEREALPYFIVYLLLTELVTLIPAPDTLNGWDYANAAFGVLITLFGTIYLYLQNGGNDGEFFIQRYLAIGWVTTIRVLVVAGPLFIFLDIFFGLPSESNVYSFSYFCLVGLVVLQRMSSHIGEVVSVSTASRPFDES